MLRALLLAHVSTCSHSTRNGPSIFEPHASGLVPLRRVEIVQCNTAALREPSNAQAVSDLSAYVNAGYAQLHGYQYTYMQVPPSFQQSAHTPWCRVAAVRQAASRTPPPEAVLYLDGDAFMLTDLPLTAAHLAGRSRAIGIDAGDIDIPDKDAMYQRWPNTTEAPLHKFMDMRVVQSLFEGESSGWAERMTEGADVVNTGGGWLELVDSETLAFLDALWAFGDTWKGGAYKHTSWAFEQSALNALLGTDARARSRTALLEDGLWNCPTSPCVAHLYGGSKTNETLLKPALDAYHRRPRAAVIVEELRPQFSR